MSHTLRRRPAFTLVGIACRASNDDPASIGALWGAFFAGGGAAQIPNRVDDRIHSLYTDYEGDHTQPYTVVLGCEVTEVGGLADGLAAHMVPAAKYAVFEAAGPQPQTLIETWMRIWETPLERTYSADFDLHLDPERVEIHVGVA